MKEKIILEIPEEDVSEVAHLIRYAICEQRVSNDVNSLLMNFCEKYGDEISDEDFMIYSTKYSNMDMYDDPNNYWYKKIIN
jgi:hypothetical protein